MIKKAFHSLWQFVNGPVRERLLWRRLGLQQEVDIVLTHGWGGGAEAYLSRKAKEVSQSRCVVVVKPSSRGVLSVTVWLRGTPVGWYFAHGLRSLAKIKCNRCRVVINELQLWEKLEKGSVVSEVQLGFLLNEILWLKKAKSARMLFLVHDYYCLCPQDNLLLPSGKYCASEYDFLKCMGCMSEQALHNPRFAVKIDRRVWCQSFLEFLKECDEVRTFSEDTQERIGKCFPELETTLVPHRAVRHYAPLRDLCFNKMVVGVVGNITVAKGSRVVFQLAEYLQTADPEVSVVIVGAIDTEGRKLLPNMRVTGYYAPDDLPTLIRSCGVNVAFFASVWPETFSYMVQELMQFELPLVCLDIGAPRSRVRNYALGSVATDSTPKTIHEALVRVFNQARRFRDVVK